jgi:metal-responsive CopG/Arc/MetJ family transcriptional regulator
MRAELKNKRVPIMMTESMKERIDAWRRPQGIDDRSEAIRRIIEERLAAEGLAQAS